MTPEQFCYWLQGRAELQPDNVPTAEEWQMIREHLATVFHKVTPPIQQYLPRSPTIATPQPLTGPLRVECKAAPQLASASTC